MLWGIPYNQWCWRCCSDFVDALISSMLLVASATPIQFFLLLLLLLWFRYCHCYHQLPRTRSHCQSLLQLDAAVAFLYFCFAPSAAALGVVLRLVSCVRCRLLDSAFLVQRTLCLLAAASVARVLHVLHVFHNFKIFSH